MKLILYDVDFNNEIQFQEGYVLSVECESATYFAQLVSALKGNEENRLAFVEKVDAIDLGKHVITLIDYYNLESYEKTLLGKLYKKLEQVYANDITVKTQIEKVQSILTRLVDTLTEGYDCNFETNCTESLAEMLKFAGMKTEGGLGNGIEGVINFISLISTLKLYKVVVFVNAKCFFNKTQLEEIYKVCAYNKQLTLFLDNKITKSKLEHEIKLLIDEDYYDTLLR